MSARIVRSSLALRPSAMPAIQRGFRTTALLRHNESEPIGPKSSDKPVSKGANTQMIMFGGVGLAIGAGFFLLMSRPDVAKDQPVDGVTKKAVSPK
ncbi:hypothetical protein FLAG1_08131 [Fusarium langsethiae]|uniref:Uncharacterized protein n=1 Tax=Fusarium langsethiae TaxID=179993 RepID=A0A0M9ESJ3_FUSLA|nr:hypothetical protein FLAG1_08131 [Fusarium langsethiae]GKU05284.1 unnamed protein product [Fusarium langsethiae]GKU17632.1 unnamed protein product [Fusarium langsethiae]